MYTPIQFYKANEQKYKLGEDQAQAGFSPFSYRSIALMWKNAHGRELWSIEDLKNIEKATFRCRYDKNVTKQCLVKKLDDDGKLWDIEAIDDIDNAHRILEIRVKRAVRT